MLDALQTKIRAMFDKARTFLHNAGKGYEPTLVRSGVVALFMVLSAFGLGSGNLPAQVEWLLTFASLAAPVLAGISIRKKVTPTKLVAAEHPKQ